MRSLGLVALRLGLAAVDPGGVSSRCKNYDACTLLTPAEVGKALGGKIGPGQPGTNTAGTATTAEIKQCRYTAKAGVPQVGFTLRCAPIDDNDASAAQLELQTVFDTYSAVTGIGGEAYWGASKRLGQLNVLIGGNLSLVFTVHGSSTQTPEQLLAAVKKLALEVINRL